MTEKASADWNIVETATRRRITRCVTLVFVVVVVVVVEKDMITERWRRKSMKGLSCFGVVV